MRKQTKIAAIVSAAALLAIGASMTSFAAEGCKRRTAHGHIITDTTRRLQSSGRSQATSGSGLTLTVTWLQTQSFRTTRTTST